MSFGVIMLNQNMNTMQNYVIWTQIALLFALKLKMFMKILHVILKKDLVHQIMKSIGPLPEGKSTKAIRLMKDKSGGKTMAEFVALRPKTYFYLMNDTKNV